MYHRSKCPSHHITNVYTINVTNTIDANLNYLAEVVFVRFLYQKVAFLPHFSILCSLEESHCTQFRT